MYALDDMANDLGVSYGTIPITQEELDEVSTLLGTDDVEKMWVDIPGDCMHLYLSADLDPCFHGMHVKGLDPESIIVDRKRMVAEAVVYACHNRVVMTGKGRERYLVEQLYKKSNPDGLKKMNERSFKREFGLYANRFNQFVDLMRSIAMLKGRVATTDPILVPLLDQKNKSRRIMKHEETTLFLTIFKDVEFDKGMSDEDIERLESALETLIGMGLVISLKDKGISIRFRKLGRTNTGGFFNPNTRDVVVSPMLAFNFCHEYAHALDCCLGISNDRSFDPLAFHYLEFLHRVDMEGVTRKLDYYMSRVEIFARLFERYVELCVEDRTLVGRKDRFIPKEDPSFDEMILGYYPRVYETIQWDPKIR